MWKKTPHGLTESLPQVFQSTDWKSSLHVMCGKQQLATGGNIFCLIIENALFQFRVCDIALARFSWVLSSCT